MSTPIEQFLSKLTELERTMTKGPWVSDGLKVENAHHDIAMCDPTPPHLRADEDARYNASGIAHLKNSNPTVCAMLRAAMQELQDIVEYWNGAPESAVDAIETVADRAHNCLAQLNTLAAEARKQGAKDE